MKKRGQFNMGKKLIHVIEKVKMKGTCRFPKKTMKCTQI